MSKLVLISFLLYTSLALSQEKKIERILGKEYKRVTSTNAYPFNEQDTAITVFPSTTFLNDTSGIAYHNQFVNFRFNRFKLAEELTYYKSQLDSIRNILELTPIDTIIAPTPIIRFIKQESVTVSEYRQFQNWVRDSIVRDELYLDEAYLTDKEALKMLQYDEEIANLDEEIPFDIGDRHLNRSLFPLNWKYPLHYDTETRNEIYKLYLQKTEQFYNKSEINPRRLQYSYVEIAQEPLPVTHAVRGHENRLRFIVSYSIPTLIDTYSWMNYAPRPKPSDGIPQVNRKEWEVLSQLYADVFPEAPIMGLTGMQARAFCDWKEMQLKQDFEKTGLPYDVDVSLPSVQDLKEVTAAKLFSIPAFNPTEIWRITTTEYTQFVEAVRDSILNEQLYYALKDRFEVAKLINYEKDYPKQTPSTLGWSIVNNKEGYRDAYSLSYDRSVQHKYPAQVDSIRQTKAYKIPSFEYRYMNEFDRSITGVLEAQYDGNLETVYVDTFFIGKDLNMGNENNRGQSSGVRSHEYFGTFYVTEQISILPETELSTQPKGEPVQGITYSQALAFYYWKYPIWKATPKKSWQQYMLPTEAEFEIVQRGEEITLPAKEVAYPTPTFRYVVHLIPRKED